MIRPPHRRHLVALAALVSSVVAPAAASAAHDVDWLTVTAGTSHQQVEDVESLADGAVIVAGWFAGTMTLGELAPLTSQGGVNVDGFVAKLSPTGTWLWARKFGGANDDMIRKVDVFADGSIAISGFFEVLMLFGGSTPSLLSVGASDAFVAKLSDSGAPVWATQVYSGTNDAIHGLEAMSDGSVAVTGKFEGGIDFGSFSLTSAGMSDVFVARTGPTGEWSTAVRAGGPDPDSGEGVVETPDGGLVVSGSFEGVLVLGSHSLTSRGFSDVFVAKLVDNGEWSWATSGGSDDYDASLAIATPGDGTVLVAGQFPGDAVFGGFAVAASGSRDIFVAKVGPLGAWIWVTAAGGTGYDSPVSIDAWSDGSAVITGHFSSAPAVFGSSTISADPGPPGGEDLFVAKIARYGKWSWAVGAGGNYDDGGESVAARADCTSVAVGYFKDEVSFGSITPAPAVGYRSFIVGVARDAMLCTPLRVGKRGVAAKRIARYAGLEIPAGSYATATVPRTSSRYCRTNGYKVYSRVTGTCRVRVTVRDRRNKRLSSAVVFLPTR